MLNTIGKVIPSDLLSKRYPVSIKGILFIQDKVLLLKNEREEWDLPGGKIDSNEQPKMCLLREILEETNLKVKVCEIVDTWMYKILGKVNVFVVFYTCLLNDDIENLKISFEHKEIKLFSLEELTELRIPEGYYNAILKSQKNMKNL